MNPKIGKMVIPLKIKPIAISRKNKPKLNFENLSKRHKFFITSPLL